MVVKPVAGVLDFTSKTAEGIKNTATIFDDKPREIRSRHPRPFYGKDKFYRDYNADDAVMFWNVLHADEEDLEQLNMLTSFEIFEKANASKYLVLGFSYERIMCLDVKEEEFLWYFSPKDVDSMQVTEEGVLIKLKNPAKLSKVFV